MRIPLPPSAILVAAVAGAVCLAGCAKQLEAPTDRGVCWAMAQLPNGTIRFNRLAQDQPDLEHCAAQLEIMRLRFKALGSTQTQLTGAYQGQFIFIQPEGVFTAQTYDGYRFPFLVRTGDGRLAMPGAMPSQ
jgi:hypothetical protein